MRNRFFLPALAALATLALISPARAGDGKGKMFDVVPANPTSGFGIRVDVDRPDRVYHEGEQMTVTVVADQDCFLYLFYLGQDHEGEPGQIVCLFPNAYQQENFITANQVVTIPAADAGFQFTCQPPFGEETLVAVGTLEPLEEFAAPGSIPGTQGKTKPKPPLPGQNQDQDQDQGQQSDPQQAQGGKGLNDGPVQKGSAAVQRYLKQRQQVVVQQDRVQVKVRPKQRPGKVQQQQYVQRLTKGAVTPLKENDLKQMVVELKDKPQPTWAESQITIITLPQGGKIRDDQGKVRTPQRKAVCIGISRYAHKRIPQLKVSHLDAEHMADVLASRCGIGDVVLLQNEDATAANIEAAIFGKLVEETRPGDTVVIFFSGHGGRCADTNGDEADGYDEYLVPHDGVLGSPETMILDDTFARWMQALDGRKIAIIMDNCHSGGTSKSIGGMREDPKGLGDKPAPLGGGSLDMLDGEARRTKDLGQQDTMIVAACKADQLAWEMPTADDGSVLTHFIIAAVNSGDSDANGDGVLSMGEIFRSVRSSVEEYVKSTFNADQNPVLLDNAGDSVILRP